MTSSRVPTTNEADRELPMVATRDIAEVALRLLVDHTWTGKERVAVVGPDHLSPAQVAEAISVVLNSPVHYHQISTEEFRANLTQYGMSDGWAAELAAMATAQNRGTYDAEPRLQAPTPTSFRSWCKKH